MVVGFNARVGCLLRYGMLIELSCWLPGSNASFEPVLFLYLVTFLLQRIGGDPRVYFPKAEMGTGSREGKSRPIL